MQRNFKDIKEVYSSTSEREVNWFLVKGWQLLDLYHKATGNLQINQTLPTYILGRPKNISIGATELKKELEQEVRKTFEAYCDDEI